ncbi:MAG: NADP-dependent malic enzyme [Bdellovibrionales bacterium]
MDINKEALEYHSKGRPGKIEVNSTKETSTARALSLAYSPGVASPCIEIAKDVNEVYKYTSKGNLVGVISNGTAVLGLGNIGPEASKPVMEGKGVLFKRFADIDVFDLELATNDVDEFCKAVKLMEPTFGGINLEDIKAPECFEIEKRLVEEMDIPVFHDDQHGTAIVSGAALLNAVGLQGKTMENIRLVVNGAGASAQACARLFLGLGVKPESLLMCDSRGVIYEGRTDGMNKYKEFFAVKTDRRSLTDAMEGADVFVGLSVAGAVTKEMIKSMAKKPIIFAMANPDPEITPDDAWSVRDDIIMATGRTDHPNQVNNVLGFPFIFRGALDVKARKINEEMKLAAVRAIAALAKESVPESVSKSYSDESFRFGPDYIIPKPFDERVLLKVAPAVAKAAMETGVAREPIEDFDKYRDELEAQLGTSKAFIRNAIHRVRALSKQGERPRIVYADGASERILRAAQQLREEGIAEPVLIGYPEHIKSVIESLELTEKLKGIEIIHPSKSEHYEDYVEAYYQRRKRKGVTLNEAKRLMADPNYYSGMAVDLGHADALITGASQNYAEAVKPILKTIGAAKSGVVAGLSILLMEDKVLFFSDTTMNMSPDAEQLAEIAIYAAEVCQYFDMEPQIAMLSHTNFTANSENTRKMQRAAEIVKERHPELTIEGEMQADTALSPEIVEKIFPFSELKKGANILIFPNLDAGNISYKMLQHLANAELFGPFLMGLRKPAHVLQRAASVEEIVYTSTLTALQVAALKSKREISKSIEV